MLDRSFALTLAALTLAAAGPARADDEGSEHTATLVGADADTLGVSLRFADATGWSMDFRGRPGAPTRHVALPFLPADHAHYQVVVGPGRATLTFVMISREQVDLATAAIWVVDPDPGANAGPLVRIILAPLVMVTHRWALGDLLTADQLAKVDRTVSHVWWLPTPLRLDGARILLEAGGRAVAIDPVRGTLGAP